MVFQSGAANVIVPGRDRFVKGIKGDLCIDYYRSISRKADDHIGPYAAIVSGHCRLFVEIAILKHTGQLYDATQLNLAPAPANMRSTQSGHQVSGLRLELQLGSGQPPYLLSQFGICSRPRLFDFANLAVNFFQRFLKRLYQLVNRFLPEFQISLCRLLKFLKRGMGQLEKRLVIVFQCITRKRLKFF